MGRWTSSNAPILGRVTYINDKGYDLTRAGDYGYSQPGHVYRKAGAYTLTATLTALPAGTTNPADKYVDTATVTARDRSPVNRLTATLKTVAGVRVMTIDTVLAANIPAGTGVSYSLAPNRRFLGSPSQATLLWPALGVRPRRERLTYRCYPARLRVHTRSRRSRWERLSEPHSGYPERLRRLLLGRHLETKGSMVESY